MSEIQKLRTWIKWQWLDHWPALVRYAAVFTLGLYLGHQL